ncbi:MAG: HEAT repeat domain-containing protein [Pseudomonadota bacterium]
MYAAELLGKTKSKAAINSLIKVMEDNTLTKDEEAFIKRDERVESEADQLKIFKQRKLLFNKLYLASSCVSALSEIGGEEVVEPLIKALKNPSHNFYQTALLGLVRIGDKRAINPIKELYPKAEEYFKIQIIDAIGKIGGEEEISFLRAIGLNKQESQERIDAAKKAITSIYENNNLPKKTWRAIERDTSLRLVR